MSSLSSLYWPPRQGLQTLQTLPIPLFASVMGWGGLTLVWLAAETHWQLAPWISPILLLISCLILLKIMLALFLKWRYAPQHLLEEFHHPIRISFFPAISIGLMLLAGPVGHYLPGLAAGMWWIGAVIHVGLTLYVLSSWMHHGRSQILHATPAWFIPVVGNLIAPVAGVNYAPIEICWFFFAVGLFFWPILKVIIFNRVMFHHPLPEQLMPTLFILLAPPTVAWIAWLKLQGIQSGAHLDAFSHLLFGFACFMALLLLSQVRYFMQLSFAFSWWAYSFPSAAFSVALFHYADYSGYGFFSLLGTLGLTFTTLMVVYLTYKTSKALMQAQATAQTS